MAISAYRDFVLVADGVVKNQAGAINKFAVSVFDSPVGQGQKKEVVTVPTGLMASLGGLEERALDQDAAKQMDVGETLGALLLPPYARELFRASLARLRDDEGLRLRLRLADELADFPWEYAYLSDARGERTSSGFLALDPRISIARHEALPVSGDWFEAADHRQVVVAMATPKPYESYPLLANLPREQAGIKAALSGIRGLRTAFLPEYIESAGAEIPGATWQGLLKTLMVEHTDILHFAGHGEFAAKGPGFGSISGEGRIILADERNEAFPMPAERLAELARGAGVRLAVLGACESGRRENRNIWSSIAAALLKAGIPAVVAMQFTVKDTLAAAFAETFYAALVAGLTVDEAVIRGRLAMRSESLEGERDARDWGTPVLYLRAPGGRVFNPVSDAQAQREAEAKLGNLFEQRLREVRGRVIGTVIGNLQDQVVTVEQVVDERVSGLMLGGYVANLQSGRLVVRQKADMVEEGGAMIGAVIPNLGGAPGEIGDQALMAGLDQYLRGAATPAAAAEATASSPPVTTGLSCPRCQGPVQSGWKFCPRCQSPLPERRERFCARCGARLAPEHLYCASCGAKVA